jgi:hypothetical protein
VNTIRNIVNFAQREEWNQPRFRQSKKKWPINCVLV